VCDLLGCLDGLDALVVDLYLCFYVFLFFLECSILYVDLVLCVFMFLLFGGLVLGGYKVIIWYMG